MSESGRPARCSRLWPAADAVGEPEEAVGELTAGLTPRESSSARTQEGKG